MVQEAQSNIWPHLKRGLLAGLVAGLAMTMAMLILRFVLGTLMLPEVLSEWFIQVMPTVLFERLLQVLFDKAKPLFFLGLTLGQVALGGAIGVGFAWYQTRVAAFDSNPWNHGAILCLGLWLLVMVAITPIAGGGFFGSDLATSAFRYTVASLLSWLVYTLVLVSLYTTIEAKAMAMALAQGLPAEGVTRRAWVKRVAIGGVTAVAAGYTLRLVLKRALLQPSTPIPFKPGLLTTEITPNSEFYTVSKNLVDPVVKEQEWSLKIEGLVERPYAMSYQELRALPSVEQYSTLECISNPIGGGLISNALWRGVPLKNLLDKAGVKPGVVDIVSHAWEGYADSMPVAKAMQEYVLVAYEMNGEPLPPKHGFPARLLVPGKFGLKSVKWLTRIEAVDHDYEGFWQIRGWSDVAKQEITSRIDTPANGDRLPLREILLGGIAFAGDRGIVRVELSFDNGKTWEDTTVKEALSPYAWVLWRKSWTPPQRGNYPIRVRAVDGDGNVQHPRVVGVEDSPNAGGELNEIFLRIVEL